MIDKHEFQLLLQSIGITASQSIIEKCMFLVDVDGSGLIELDECMAFFKARCVVTAVVKRLWCNGWMWCNSCGVAAVV